MTFAMKEVGVLTDVLHILKHFTKEDLQCELQATNRGSTGALCDYNINVAPVYQ